MSKDIFLKYKNQIIAEARARRLTEREELRVKEGRQKDPEWMQGINEKFDASLDEATYNGWKMRMVKDNAFQEWERLRLDNPDEYKTILDEGNDFD